MRTNSPARRPMTRYSITMGRFTVTDFFDNNRYSHDPRTQFMGWALMYNGAWDYPADTRGYTWGWVHEFHTERWSVRYGSAAEPKVANGLRFDRRLCATAATCSKASGTTRSAAMRAPSGTGLLLIPIPVVTPRRFSWASNPYQARCHRYTPRRPLKYGVGVNLEQEIAKDIGVFGRLGWNDGKTESFAFTAIDRLATGGVSVTGTRWKRPTIPPLPSSPSAASPACMPRTWRAAATTS